MRPLIFKRYPEEVPADEEYFFFIYSGFYTVTSGFARTEYTWDDHEGCQVIYTGKETEEEIKSLIEDGYKKSYFFIPEEGSPTPYGHFLWCPVELLDDIYAEEYPDEFV